MPKALAALARFGSAAIAAGLFAFASVANASPDWDLVELRQTLHEVSKTLIENPTMRELDIEDVMAEVDWQLPNVSPSPSAVEMNVSPAQFGWMDARLALAPIHHIYGAKGAGPVMDALQGYGLDAVVIEDGTATLGQLRASLTNRQMSYDLESDVHTLRVPLVIGENAALRLSHGDKLAISRKDGAFVVGMGRVEVIGAKVWGTKEESLAHESFRPFVTLLGGAHIEDAWFADLGFGNSVKYSGLSLLSHPTFGATGRTIVHRSRFDHLVTLSVVGLSSPEIERNRFFSMERNALLIARSAYASVAGNIFSGPSPTNAVRIMHGSVNARVEGNVVLEGARAGFLVSGGSDNARVAGNLIWRRNGGGIKLSEVECGVVTGNLVLDDKQKGIEIRDSANVVIDGNDIIGNRTAGIWISAVGENNVTHVAGNLIRENGSGLSTAQGGEIALVGNDFRNQYPRFLDGELTHEFREIAGNLRGATPLVMSAFGTEQKTVSTGRACADGTLE